MGVFLLGLRILETVALYAFFIFVFLILWKFYNGQTVTNPFRQKRFIRIALLNAIGDTILTREFSDEQPVQIGRDAGNELVLASGSVSSKHAAIFFESEQWWLEDNNSLNGTYLNESKIVGRAALLPDDHVRCGDQMLKINFKTEK